MIYTSLISWMIFFILLCLSRTVPERRRVPVLATGSWLLLVFNDFLAGAIAAFLTLLSLRGPGWARSGERRSTFRLVVLYALILLPLLLFKYRGLWAVGNPAAIASPLLHPSALAFPLGLSYFTFKAVMYVRSQTRGEMAPMDLTAFVAYLVFAPAASAGPIDRPRHFSDQLARRPALDLDTLYYAGYRITTGLILKFLVADTLQTLIGIRLGPEVMACSRLHFLLFGPSYALLIYTDFAGYSSIAIGCAALLGITSMENFDSPYLKPNIAEFWRSWHISLTGFLRDYIYLPCAFRWSRLMNSNLASALATLVTFVICGAWHGTGANFVLWGLYHGFLLATYQLYLRQTRRVRFIQRLRRQAWSTPAGAVFTFVLVCLGWYLFAFNLSHLSTMVRGLL